MEGHWLGGVEKDVRDEKWIDSKICDKMIIRLIDEH